jgi:hypothetical protein
MVVVRVIDGEVLVGWVTALEAVMGGGWGEVVVLIWSDDGRGSGGEVGVDIAKAGGDEVHSILSLLGDPRNSYI